MNRDYSAFKIEEILSDKTQHFRDIWVPGTKLVVNLNSVLSTLLYREIEESISFDANDKRNKGTVKYIARIQDTLNKFIYKCEDIDVELIILCMTDAKNTVMRKYCQGWYEHLAIAETELPKVFRLYELLVGALKKAVKRMSNGKFVDTLNIEPFAIAYGLQGSIIYLTRDKTDYLTVMNNRTIIISTGVYGKRVDAKHISDLYGIDIVLLPLYYSICGISKRDYKGLPGKNKAYAKKIIRKSQFEVLHGTHQVCDDIKEVLGVPFKMLEPKNYLALADMRKRNTIDRSLMSEENKIGVDKD